MFRNYIVVGSGGTTLCIFDEIGRVRGGMAVDQPCVYLEKKKTHWLIYFKLDTFMVCVNKAFIKNIKLLFERDEKKTE